MDTRRCSRNDCIEMQSLINQFVQHFESFYPAFARPQCVSADLNLFLFYGFFRLKIIFHSGTFCAARLIAF
ncbi:MAG: hypothetical protein R3F47_16345 [Gammaproteobacteria bacterium]